MERDKFLQQIADYYLRIGADMSHMTFVFPNRRSAIFMRKYMQESLRKPQFMPRMISITYFIQQLNQSSLASQTELNFTLYKAYCSVLKKHGRESQIPDFDKFYFWGSIILNDFNDVDAYMVNAKDLYRNLKDLKEIKACYLTPEQLEVVKYLWGDNYPISSSEDFWEHMPSEANPELPSSKFINLWEIMGELYDEFQKELAEQPTPLSYSGLQSRKAYERIKTRTKEDFKGMKYVFIGFNVLSTSRALIFRRLKDLGIAEFFWDVVRPLSDDNEALVHTANRFIEPLAKMLPMPADFVLESPVDSPKIEIISVPSNYGQTKTASSILTKWAEQWKEETGSDNIPAEKLLDTAIILADEQLLMPMLYSVEPNISPINVSMGVSYSSTPFAALMSSIISMHLRAQKRKGAYTYYYQDIIDVISHPHISLIAQEASDSMREYITHNHLYNVRADEIQNKYPPLAFIFDVIEDVNNILQVRQYIDNLICHLRDMLRSKIGASDNDTNYYELHILDAYSTAIEDLCQLACDHKINMQEHTFLHMIERTLAQTPINFIGSPLKGLQIMSVMDTRGLDFDNLIMLSMNERIFPKRNYTPSLIPWNLRAGYILPTPEYEESSYAYQFYRLISRAKNVSLIYDSRTAGITSGEMSRYLSQLLHLNKGADIRTKAVEFKVQADEVKPIIINKTPDVIAQLQRYKPGAKDPLKLSASALKDYLKCPLKFYLQDVCSMRDNDEAMEYIDAASYGTVIHHLVQTMYLHYRGQTIDDRIIDQMLKSDIETEALKTLDSIYYKERYKDNLNQLPGEGQVIAKIIAQYVRKMLTAEKDFTPYKFVDAEFGERIMHHWKINDKYTINFTMSIDRIDQLADTNGETYLKFIDYKTGGDKLNATTLDTIFNNSDYHGIFQLLLYCNAYAQIYNYSGKIKPIIYKLQSIPKEGIQDLKISKKIVDDYSWVNDIEGGGFMERFEEIIDKIFEEENEYPFVQTSNQDNCLYCHFKQMCSRYPEKKNK